jgi:hypothetical protein
MSASDSLDRVSKEIIAKFVTGMELACELPESLAKDKCPVDEGLLRAKIDHEVTVERTQIVGRIGTNVEYAPYVHQGTGIHAVDGKGRKTPWAWEGETAKWNGTHITRGQKPKPFLRDAVLESKGQIIHILASLQKGIRGAT